MCYCFLCLNSNKRFCIHILILSVVFLSCDRNARDVRSRNIKKTSSSALPGWKFQVPVVGRLSSAASWKAVRCFWSRCRASRCSWRHLACERGGAGRDTCCYWECWSRWDKWISPPRKWEVDAEAKWWDHGHDEVTLCPSKQRGLESKHHMTTVQPCSSMHGYGSVSLLPWKPDFKHGLWKNWGPECAVEGNRNVPSASTAIERFPGRANVFMYFMLWSGNAPGSGLLFVTWWQCPSLHLEGVLWALLFLFCRVLEHFNRITMMAPGGNV